MAKGVKKTHRPDMMMQMLLTHNGLTHGRSAMKPDNTLPIVLVMPMIEMRKVAYSGSTPCKMIMRKNVILLLLMFFNDFIYCNLNTNTDIW